MFLAYLILIILAFFLGASIASFLCVVAERTERGESINGTSHCACGRPLKATENIPVLGYLRIKGKAKCCGAVLPRHYLYSEIFLGIVFAIVTAIVLTLFTLAAFIVLCIVCVVASVSLLVFLKKRVQRLKN